MSEIIRLTKKTDAGQVVEFDLAEWDVFVYQRPVSDGSPEQQTTELK